MVSDTADLEVNMGRVYDANLHLTSRSRIEVIFRETSTLLTPSCWYLRSTGKTINLPK